MTATRMTRTMSTVGALAALALTLAACGGGDSAGTTESASPEQSASAESSASAEPSETKTTEAPPAAAGDVADCIKGSWEMDTDAMMDEVTKSMGGSDAVAGMEMSVSGTSSVTLDGSTWTSDVDTTSSFTMTVSDQTLEGTTVTKGKIVMDYVLEGDQITQTEVVSAEGTSTTTMGGEEHVIDLAQTADLTAGTSQTVTCDAKTMTLTATTGDTALSQHFTRK